MLDQLQKWPVLTRLALPAILAAALLINFTSFRPGHDWNGDPAWYLAQARAIVSGTMAEVAQQGAFRNANTEGYQPGPNIYPWGYPFLISPIHDAGLTALKSVLYLIYIAGFSLLYLLHRDRPHRLWMIGVLALSPWLFEFKNLLLPAAPFFAVTMLGLLAIKHYVIDHRGTSPVLHGAIVGVALFMAYWIKSQGLVLVVTLALVHIRLGPKPHDIIPYVIFGGACLLAAMLPGSTSYVGSDHFSYAGAIEFLHISARHVVSYMRYTSEFILGDGPKPVTVAVGAIFLTLSAIGAFARWREDYLYLAFIAVNIGLLLPYRWAQARFALIVFPFLLYFAIHGAARFRMQRYFGAAVLGVAAISTATAWVGVQRNNPMIEGPYTPEAQEAFAFIRRNTPAEAVFAFFKPRVLTQQTGRSAFFRYNQPLRQVDYALLYKGIGRTGGTRNDILGKALQANPVWQNKKFALYRLKEKQGLIIDRAPNLTAAFAIVSRHPLITNQARIVRPSFATDTPLRSEIGS